MNSTDQPVGKNVGLEHHETALEQPKPWITATDTPGLGNVVVMADKNGTPAYVMPVSEVTEKPIVEPVSRERGVDGKKQQLEKEKQVRLEKLWDTTIADALDMLNDKASARTVAFYLEIRHRMIETERCTPLSENTPTV